MTPIEKLFALLETAPMNIIDNTAIEKPSKFARDVPQGTPFRFIEGTHFGQVWMRPRSGGAFQVDGTDWAGPIFLESNKDRVELLDCTLVINAVLP